ncbi:MAG: OmpA family protein [Bacteroidota bacterium]
MKKSIKLLPLFTLLILAACVPTRQFRELGDKSRTLEEKRDQLMADNERLTVENTEMKARADRIRDQREKFMDDSLRMSRELAQVKKEKDQLQRSYEDLEASHDALLAGNARETKRLLGELQSTQEDLARKESMLKNLEGNVSEQRQDLLRLGAELEARNARLVEMERLLYRKDSLMNSLKETVQKALLGFEGQGLTVTQKNGMVYVSLEEKLLFKSGSTDVDPNGKKALQQLAGVLARNPEIRIMIEGHTDNVPFRKGSSIKDNWDLSVMRATSIVRILLEGTGIDPKRITASGRGEFLPVDPADTPEARTKNRRTEIILSPNLDELYKLLQN